MYSSQITRSSRTNQWWATGVSWRVPVLLLLLLGLISMLFLPVRLRSVHAADEARAGVPDLKDPDVVCAGCHASIYASYKHTAMGSGSGAALDAFQPAAFNHVESGVQYRLFAEGGRAWMAYSRGAAAQAPPISGKHELVYFIGSGRHGRTYLYQQMGQWFELPVNWYTRRSQLGMAPAFDSVSTMPAPLPVDANCLHCHATAVQTPLPEAHNRFEKAPFLQGGVGCSACHGDPSAHLAAQGHGPILNPGKMNVAARDSACTQCHLEGDAVVYRPGRSLAAFVPGQNLFDFALYFVRASQTGGGQRASSQYEALLKSACKRASGDALTCTSCHDPHSEPTSTTRIAFYRAKCLQCHTAPALATTHYPEQPDCATCHMPTRKTTDISHEQSTDHDIERQPARAPSVEKAWVDGEKLVVVGDSIAGDRELGLAYAQRAQKGDKRAAITAKALLLKAEAAGSDDAAVHVNLGWLQQVDGNIAAARHEYALALTEDPYDASALVNRAVLDVSAGNAAEAVRLLDRLVRVDPSQTLAGVDLITLECRGGEKERAAALLSMLYELNPDAPQLRPYLRSPRQPCTP